MRHSTPRHTPLTRHSTATNSLGKSRSFIYAVDRTGSNTTRQSTYTYDVTNQRIAKTVDLDGAGTAPATTTRFVYDRNNVALEFTGSVTTPSTRYFHGTNVDQVLAQESNNATTWLLSDQIGTTRDLVNNNGTLLNHFTYDSFGNQTGSTLGAAVDTRYKFTGREFDGETGDYFYRSRYYDPEVGRFLGEDSIGFAGSDANLYRYVENNPLTARDPSGLFKVEFRYRHAFGNAFNHADIVVTDNNGQMNSYWARAKNIDFYNIFIPLVSPWGGEGFGHIVADKAVGGKYKPGFVFYVSDPNNIQLLYENDQDCKKQEHQAIEEKIKRGLSNIEAAHIPYWPFDKNSNSAAFQVIRDLGIVKNLRPKSGVNPIGWELNPYQYWKDWQNFPKPSPQPGPRPSPRQ
jgi:RHS repeat-associated protein